MSKGRIGRLTRTKQNLGKLKAAVRSQAKANSDFLDSLKADLAKAHQEAHEERQNLASKMDDLNGLCTVLNYVQDLILYHRNYRRGRM